MLDRLSDTPALILSSLGETLVQNRMADALFGDSSRHTGPARSEVYRWFTDPFERLRYPEGDRDRQSRAQVAMLRAAYGSMGPQSQAGELARALQKVSAEFCELWDRHEVARRFTDHKTLLHPELGPVEVDCQALFTSRRRCSCSPPRRAAKATKNSGCSLYWVTSVSPTRQRAPTPLPKIPCRAPLSNIDRVVRCRNIVTSRARSACRRMGRSLCQGDELVD